MMPTCANKTLSACYPTQYAGDTLRLGKKDKTGPVEGVSRPHLLSDRKEESYKYFHRLYLSPSALFAIFPHLNITPSAFLGLTGLFSAAYRQIGRWGLIPPVGVILGGHHAY